jgi:hypothetical protein
MAITMTYVTEIPVTGSVYKASIAKFPCVPLWTESLVTSFNSEDALVPKAIVNDEGEAETLSQIGILAVDNGNGSKT